MIVIFCAWLACLAVVILMIKRAPLVDEDPSEDESPDDRTNSSEFRSQPVY